MSNKPPIPGKGKGASSSPKKQGKKPINKKKNGRPTKYLEKYNEIAEKLCAECGLDDAKLALCFGIPLATLKKWKSRYEDFLSSIKKGKDVWDSANVERSFLKRAMGFEYDETTREPLYNAVTGEPIRDKEGNHIIATTKIVRKMVVPDTAAGFIWLKNRQPDRWKDKQEIEHSGKNGGPIETTAGQEVRAIIEDLAKVILGRAAGDPS